ncbi:hypothetical protein GE061_007938 [Apolygus lucorum]|uniref:C2H2-type domain-containing protein n=1 Tax=Apolygus lucorum TaxID=248454 RepID=A0A8S9WPX8_APOLU|nr:hypothetical protein GE061_007938 [Apolygus lucorum]
MHPYRHSCLRGRDRPSTTTPEIGRHHCPQCPERFTTKRGLGNHLNAHTARDRRSATQPRLPAPATRQGRAPVARSTLRPAPVVPPPRYLPPPDLLGFPTSDEENEIIPSSIPPQDEDAPAPPASPASEDEFSTPTAAPGAAPHRSSGPQPPPQHSSGPQPPTQHSSGPQPPPHRSSGPQPPPQHSLALSRLLNTPPALSRPLIAPLALSRLLNTPPALNRPLIAPLALSRPLIAPLALSRPPQPTLRCQPPSENSSSYPLQGFKDKFAALLTLPRSDHISGRQQRPIQWDNTRQPSTITDHGDTNTAPDDNDAAPQDDAAASQDNAAASAEPLHHLGDQELRQDSTSQP